MAASNLTQQEETSSEPIYATATEKAKTDYPYYLPNIDKYLVPETRELLKKYSGIPLEKQSEHVHRIRDLAFRIRAYPCTGLGTFLTPYISLSPAYQTIITRLRNERATFLDIGCHLGADMRRLAFDGAPTDKMIGLDIVSHWEVGFEMYKDRDWFKARFVEANILDKENDYVDRMLSGKMDIVSMSAVLHQWSWEKQVEAAERVVSFSRAPGTLVVGHQIGNVEAGKMVAMGVSVWKHDASTFQKLWAEVGEKTGTRWEVEARLLPWEYMGWDPKDTAFMPKGDQVLDFVVKRLS
ncbi:MAG: hypothetical protein Q9227_001370 [Pyrenula ochraceoflavens]